VPVGATAKVTSTGTAAVVTMTNTGTNPLPVSTVTLAGGNPDQFAISADTCLGATLTEAPVAGGVGGSCTISVSFTPTSQGNKTGRIVVTSGATTLTTPTIGILTGTGIRPTAGLSPNPLAFGSQGVNTSTTQTILYTNTSAASSVTIAMVTVVGGGTPPQFTATGCVNTAVAAGTSCAITVTFTPTSAGAQAATLTVRDTAGGAANATAALTGTGIVPPINLAGNTNYGTVPFMSTSTHSFTLSNTGSAALTINTIAVAKTSGGGVYIVMPSGTCAAGNSVPARGTCTVDVEFAPMLGTASTTATLTVTGVAPNTTAPVYTTTRNLTGN
jgi:Abnormal spindle-like microcephaly-assoc'd, ASPM-SPD-2-Hydin